MITRKIAFVIFCISVLLIGLAQSAPKEEKKTLPPELQNQVNDAISKGTEYLYKYVASEELDTVPLRDYNGFDHTMRYADLILYTLAHCGVATNEDWDKFLQRVTELKLDKVYHVSLQAIALEHIDREKYQARIADCAQYLVDTQCKNGQWSYGTERTSPRWVKTGQGKEKIVVTGNGQKTPAPKASSGSTQSKKITPIKITGAPQGPADGDNSNTQYAILGLRACIESNVSVPEATLKSAQKWLLACQNKNGSWGYCSLGMTSTGYGSMTVGALGTLAITKYYLKELKDVNSEPWFNNGLKWVSWNYTVSKNPEGDPRWLYYYLYAMERLGVLAEQEKIGNNSWYSDGAKFLVAKQSETGEWNDNLSDTCFALLFLTKATKPLKIVTTGK
ncbi:MAG: terpene cyclase/mutase family protein [Planctomycetes bacterium]|nr:terpene cyclase/mutase family protein [Planctomycetota bacterium]